MLPGERVHQEKGRRVELDNDEVTVYVPNQVHVKLELEQERVDSREQDDHGDDQS